MGDSVNNCAFGVHLQQGSFLDTADFGLHRHYGQAGIDTPSPRCGRDAWRVYRDACLSGTDAQMDAAGIMAFGPWYITNVINSGLRSTYRATVQATCG